MLIIFIVHSGKSEGIKRERMDQKHREKNCSGSVGRTEGKCGPNVSIQILNRENLTYYTADLGKTG